MTNPTAPAVEGEYPQAINAWLDETPGNSFTWELVGYDQAPSRFGRDVVIATFRDDEGQDHALWLSATVLVSQFARVKPLRGEKVQVVFLGIKGERGYKNYKVTCPDRPAFEPDWAALALDEDDEGVVG